MVSQHPGSGKAGGNGTLAAALDYLRAGLSTIPIRLDGSKAPALETWDPYKDRLPTEDEARGWWCRESPPGMGLVGGRVSGHLERIDFDALADVIYPEWVSLVEAECPGLVGRLPVVRTPRAPAGYHVYFRCPEVPTPGNAKLAVDPMRPPRERTLIETRGEGGYTVAPGSPPACHETGRTWEHVAGPPVTKTPAISSAERGALLRCAGSFDRSAAPEQPPDLRFTVRSGEGFVLLPGADFVQRGPPWGELLEPHGWTEARRCGDVIYWRRPDKARGWSATTGRCRSEKGGDLLAVFSENADPFEGPRGGRACSCYSKFAAYALLNHKGDFKAAAQALAGQGYGERRPTGHRPGAGAPVFALGPLSLRPGPPRQSNYKTTVPLAVLRGEASVDHISLSSVFTGRKQAAQALARLAGGDTTREEADAVLGLILGHAAEQLATKKVPSGGRTVAQVVAETVPERLGLFCRTPKGVWSEVRGGEMARHEFVSYLPTKLVEEASQAVDAPRLEDGTINRQRLLKVLKAELEACWSDQQDRLPPLEEANLGENSALGRAFRAALKKLWTRPHTFELPGANDRDARPSRASLASRARRQAAPLLSCPETIGSRVAWTRVHEGFNAWWRPALVEGEVRILLGMTWTLASQVGVDLPGATDQPTMNRLGQMFGAFDPAPPGPTRTSGGGNLGVLTHEVTSELLEETSERDAEPVQ